MNLWQRLEQRGRDRFDLDETYHLYAADLKDYDNIAEIKLCKMDRAKYLTETSVVGNVKYMDLR